MSTYIPVDRSARCRIRTARVLVPSQQSAQGATPVAVPMNALRGRRWLRILNHGLVTDPTRDKVFVIVGGGDVRWSAPSPSTLWGYGLDRLESIDLAVEDSVEVFCVADPSLLDGQFIDVRTVELA